jgi:hypothetical protein
MVNATRLALALMVYATNSNAYLSIRNTIAVLTQVMRSPCYRYQVVYPIARATADDDDGHQRQVFPSEEATAWLRDSELHGEIGPWDSTLDRTANGRLAVIVSFEREEDAVLFRLGWC